MWVIAGLGNPGEKYSATRHNIGFMVVDRLSEEYRVPFTVKDDYSLGKGAIDHVNVILLKPLTYMNLSGSAVRKILKKTNLLQDGEITNFIVIHDDLDLETGVVKIRRNGSSGGHRIHHPRDWKQGFHQGKNRYRQRPEDPCRRICTAQV